MLAQALPFQRGPAHSVADVAVRFKGARVLRTPRQLSRKPGGNQATPMVVEGNRALAEEALDGAKVIREPLRLGAA